MVWPSTVATGCFGLASAFCAEPAVAQAMQTSDNNAILKGAESIARVYPRAERKNRSRKRGVPEPPAGAPASRAVTVVCLSYGQEATRKVLVSVPPEYPQLLKSKEIGGLVKLRVVISPSGTVRSTGVVGGNPILAEAAARAIKKWRYVSAPDETVTVVEFRFNQH